MLGFPASVVARLTVGIAFTIAAGAMVWAIERPRGPSLAPTATDAVVNAGPGSTVVAVSIESSYPVSAWTVQVLGIDQPATRSDQGSWTGLMQLGLDDEVFIQAKATPGASHPGTVPHRCLRIRLGSTPDRFIWSSGDVTATAGIAP